ncbi:DUF188 domain-containing protein [Peptostreptococcaceae bacterium OttesenSCG-928-C18]|nr:DUF188 domain-containing protein [Peptostreptococcaceae bacterium OttesenSCG-928-C18]
MIIYIDADSCPVIDSTIEIAEIYNLKTVVVKDYNHKINIDKQNVDIITIEQGNDSADIYILSKISKNDILITNDIGLSSIALGKEANVINFYGKIINDFNIDQLLFERHVGKINRKNNIYGKKIKKRNSSDNLNFQINLKNLISQNIK